MPSITPLHEQYTPYYIKPLTVGDVVDGIAKLAATSSVETSKILSEISREIFKELFNIDPAIPRKYWSSNSRERFYRYISYVIKVQGIIFSSTLKAFGHLLPLDRSISHRMQVLVNMLNGVMGDHLISQQNPLALPMVIHDRFALPKRIGISGDVVIFVHGLCMSMYSWHITKQYNMAEAILKINPNATILYLNYNTGRRIANNGLNFSQKLETLVKENPEINSIQLVGHSMGGLVTRSALFYAKQEGYVWQNKVKDVICLGSPHHGAVLERFGFYLQQKVTKLPVAKVLARIGDIRSAGILDLRHGSVRYDDWEFQPERVGEMNDTRRPAPFAKSIRAYLVAGTIQESEQDKNKLKDILGDYLVSVPSALGEHPNPDHNLNVPESRKKVFWGVNHMELQYHPEVIEWVALTLTTDIANDHIEALKTATTVVKNIPELA